jgi:hypothetical protein
MADEPTGPTDNRTPNGRFAAGNPGGPGRTPGVPNRLGQTVRSILEANAPTLLRQAIEDANNGDKTMRALLVGKIIDKGLANARAIEPLVSLDLPPVATPGDLPVALAVIVSAMASGALRPETAKQIVQVLDGQARALDMHRIANRVHELEELAHDQLARAGEAREEAGAGNGRTDREPDDRSGSFRGE